MIQSVKKITEYLNSTKFEGMSNKRQGEKDKIYPCKGLRYLITYQIQ